MRLTADWKIPGPLWIRYQVLRVGYYRYWGSLLRMPVAHTNLVELKEYRSLSMFALMFNTELPDLRPETAANITSTKTHTPPLHIAGISEAIQQPLPGSAGFSMYTIRLGNSTKQKKAYLYFICFHSLRIRGYTEFSQRATATQQQSLTVTEHRRCTVTYAAYDQLVDESRCQSATLPPDRLLLG